MSARRILSLIAAVATAACYGDATTAPTAPDLVPQASVIGGAAQPADIIEDLGGAPDAVIHAASLLRQPNGITISMEVSAPSPNTATMWAVIFNSPSDCAASPCGLADLGNEDVKASVLRAGGRVLGGSGPTTFTGSVRESDTSEALFGPGLMDAMTAEIHAIFRLHGPPIPGEVDDQIHEVGGGCEQNDCFDPAAAIFLPPS